MMMMIHGTLCLQRTLVFTNEPIQIKSNDVGVLDTTRTHTKLQFYYALYHVFFITKTLIERFVWQSKHDKTNMCAAAAATTAHKIENYKLVSFK